MNIRIPTIHATPFKEKHEIAWFDLQLLFRENFQPLIYPSLFWILFFNGEWKYQVKGICLIFITKPLFYSVFEFWRHEISIFNHNKSQLKRHKRNYRAVFNHIIKVSLQPHFMWQDRTKPSFFNYNSPCKEPNEKMYGFVQQ